MLILTCTLSWIKSSDYILFIIQFISQRFPWVLQNISANDGVCLWSEVSATPVFLVLMTHRQKYIEFNIVKNAASIVRRLRTPQRAHLFPAHSSWQEELWLGLKERRRAQPLAHYWIQPVTQMPTCLAAQTTIGTEHHPSPQMLRVRCFKHFRKINVTLEWSHRISTLPAPPLTEHSVVKQLLFISLNLFRRWFHLFAFLNSREVAPCCWKRDS